MWRGFPFVDYISHGHAVWFLGNELGTCFTSWHNHDLDCGLRVSILPCWGLALAVRSPTQSFLPAQQSPRPGPLHPLCICFNFPGLSPHHRFRLPPINSSCLTPTPTTSPGSDDQKPLLVLQSVVAHGLRCSAACGIFRDRESNPPLLIGRQILYH